MMRNGNVFLTKLLALLAIALVSQTVNGQDLGPRLHLEPEALFFETVDSHDTLLVINSGDEDLMVDSVKASTNFFGYGIGVTTKDTTFYWELPSHFDRIGQFERNKLVLAPSDSAFLIFSAPDLCPICLGGQSSEFFTDTLLIFTNDTTNNPTETPMSGQGQLSAVEEKPEPVPQEFDLQPNYPNPFNPATNIRFTLRTGAEVRLSIYNPLGQEVRNLSQGRFPAGDHLLVWDGLDDDGFRAGNGVYFLRMTAGSGQGKAGFTKTVRMLLSK